MRERFPALTRYLRAHRIPALGSLILAVCLLQAWAGGHTITVPTADDTGGLTLAYRNLLPLVPAVLAVASLHSPMAALEAAGSDAVHRAKALHAVAMTVFAAVSLLLAEALAAGFGPALAAVRSLLVWTGLALVGGRVFGWPSAWSLPLATVFPLTYYNRDGRGQVYGWNWISLPPDDVGAWLIAAAALACGAAAFSLTPWRLRRPRPSRR